MSTKKGPGRKHDSIEFPAGTKLIRRFIKDATGENHEYRKDLQRIADANVKLDRRIKRQLKEAGSHD